MSSPMKISTAAFECPLNKSSVPSCRNDFAANPDPAESDPAKLDPNGLKDAVPGWKFLYDSDWRGLEKNASAVGQRGELHRPMLWAVLVLLIVESVLAWKFGHHR